RLFEQYRVSNDEEIFAELYRKYRDRMAAWCRSVGVPESELEDALHEAWIAVRQAAPRFRRDPGGSFHAWFCTIVLCTGRKIRDRHARRPAASGGSDNQDFLASLEQLANDSADDFRLAYLKIALNSLRQNHEDQYQAVLSKYFERRDDQEVADELGITVDA